MKTLQTVLWDMRRFGMTPKHLIARIMPPAATPRILSISIPKSGTHLIEKALCEHPDIYRPIVPTIHKNNINRFGGLEKISKRIKNGQLIVAHLGYNPAYLEILSKQHIHALFIYRDPRDAILSLINHALKDPKHHLHKALINKSLIEQINLLSTGDEALGVVSILNTYRHCAGWLKDSAFSVSYEALIGPQGGGSQNKQEQTLINLFKYLNLTVSDAFIHQTAQKVFSPLSPTFHKGQIGGWKAVMPKPQQNLINQLGQDVLETYAYE